ANTTSPTAPAMRSRADRSCSTAIIAPARTRIPAGSRRRCSKRCSIGSRMSFGAPNVAHEADILAGATQVGHSLETGWAFDRLGRSMAALEISPVKVGYVIVKARECAAKVGAWDDGDGADRDGDSILESFSDDATRAELKAFIRDLNEDERASL